MKFQYVGKPCGSASLNFVCGITISLVLCKEGLMLSPGDVRSSSYLFMDPHPLEIGFLGSKGNCQQLFSPLFLLCFFGISGCFMTFRVPVLNKTQDFLIHPLPIFTFAFLAFLDVSCHSESFSDSEIRVFSVPKTTAVLSMKDLHIFSLLDLHPAVGKARGDTSICFQQFCANSVRHRWSLVFWFLASAFNFA